MQVNKKEFYAQIHEFCNKHDMTLQSKNSGNNYIYYPAKDDQNYAPIGEINVVMVSTHNGIAATYGYFILDSISKKPKKVKM